MPRRICGLSLALAVVLIAGVVSTLSAQIAGAALTGLVTDPQGAPLPGVTVTIVQAGTGASRVAVTGTDGAYALVALAPGTYRLTMALAGFQPVDRRALRLTTGQTARLDVVMLVGNIRADVQVVADTPVLRAESAGLGATVDHEQVVGLPLNGRTFITLAALAPGVALPPNSQLPRINGGRPRTNEYLFDGISVLQPEPGQVAYFPIIDAIQEFKIESNSPPAEFGRFNGGVINLTTRAGTNGLRGNLFEFFRHEGLNARNFFQTANTSKPEYRRNQFGGTAGGPIARDRTFFFADYQGQRQSIARTAISTVPTALQRQGVFTEAIGGRVPVIYDPATTTADRKRTPFTSNTIPVDRMDAVALSLLQRYPLPTSAGTSNNFRRTDLEGDDQNQWDVRVDHRFASNRDQAFARITAFHDDFTPVTPLPDGSGITTGTLGPQDTTARSFASNYLHLFSASLVNEVRVGDTRRSVDRQAASLPTTAGEALGIPGIPSSAQFPSTLPTFLISGYQQIGSPANTASNFRTGVTEVADTLTWLRGRHTVKAGTDWRWERLDVVQPPSPTGSFTFNALGSDLPGTSNTGTPLASFLLGQVQLFTIDLQRSTIQERAHFGEFFVQDNWKATRRLTVNLGLRYTLNFPSTEINGQTAVFDLASLRLDYPGDEPVRPLKKDNFGPRAGLTYLAGDRTVLSAGYGKVWIEMAGITTPFTTPSFPFLQTASQRALDTITPAFVLHQGPSVSPVSPTPDAGLGQGVFAVNAALGSGYAQQWNASLQRSLSSNTVLEISYVGSKITNVGLPDSNLNQLTVEQLATGAPLLDQVPNPFFGQIPRSSSLGDPTISRAQLMKPYPQYTTVSLYRNNTGTTRYDGLEVSVRRRLARGLTYSAAYTRSKLVDDASSVFDASILTGPIANAQVADSHNLEGERDYSTGDIPHVFVSSVVWDVPYGRGRARQPGGWLGALISDWTVTGLATLQSGMPFAITQTTNFDAFAGFGIQRPNLVGDPQLPSDQRTADHWVNPAAFATAPQFTLGSASRNPARGPAYRDVDLGVSRRVAAGGSRTVELRIEAFNLLNNVNYAQPNAVFGAANFGSIISAFDPRVVQLAVKFAF